MNDLNERNVVDNECEQSNNDSEKNKIFLKIGRAFKTTGKKIIDTSIKGVQYGVKKSKDIYKSIKDNNDFKKEVKNNTYEYQVVGTNTVFRAFRDGKSRLLLLMEMQHISKTVKSNSILICTEDNSKLVVETVDLKNAIQGSLTFKEEEVPISLFAINTKAYVEKDPIVINTVNQNMNISNSTIDGNIQMISDISVKLNDFEAILKQHKPSLFNRKTYNEAIKIYGDVKDSIINGNKESSIVKSFLSLLSKIGDGLLQTFINIIN